MLCSPLQSTKGLSFRKRLIRYLTSHVIAESRERCSRDVPKPIFDWSKQNPFRRGPPPLKLAIIDVSSFFFSLPFSLFSLLRYIVAPKPYERGHPPENLEPFQTKKPLHAPVLRSRFLCFQQKYDTDLYTRFLYDSRTIVITSIFHPSSVITHLLAKSLEWK